VSSSSSSWLWRASGISAGAALSYSSSIASLAQTVSPGAGSDEAGLQTARSKVRSKHALKVVGRSSREEMGHVHGDRLADLPLPRKLAEAPRHLERYDLRCMISTSGAMQLVMPLATTRSRYLALRSGP
jgi:hypothetical protein